MNIFIGSSTESLGKAEEIAAYIDRNGHTAKIWTDEGFLAGRHVLDCLINVANRVDAAIFVFNEDDTQWYRKNQVAAVRDNVLVEYGLFCGILGKHNVAICVNGEPKIASDLSGLIYIDINKWADAKIKLKQWLEGCESKQDSVADAQFKLGKCYNQGVAKDNVTAAYWYKKAAERGHIRAQCRLGSMYINKNGVPQNYEEAVYWFKQAEDDGEAQGYLGWMYMNGNGVERNYDKALFYLREAAEKGWAASKTNLGWMYMKGYGVPQDYEQALFWTRQAANAGRASAYDSLGYMHEYGLGVPKDHLQAIEYYKEAIKRGYLRAEEALKRLNALD